jgi:tyrosyl-tRNA synthetase
MREHPLAAPTPIIDLIVDLGFAKSRGEARRLIEQGGVYLDGATVIAFDHSVSPAEGHVLQIGKRRFVRLVPA